MKRKQTCKSDLDIASFKKQGRHLWSLQSKVVIWIIYSSQTVISS